MPRVEESRVIKASRAKVWEVAANPETMLKWWPGSKSVEILSREGNTMTVRGVGAAGGREVTMTEKWTLHPQEKIETEIFEGPILGSSVQRFEEVPEGTRVVWSSDIRFKGVLGGIVGRLFWFKVKDSMTGERSPLVNMGKYIEAQQSS